MNAMTEDDLATYNEERIDVAIKNKAIKDAEDKFHSSRKMFYFDAKAGDIRFPDAKNINKSHEEWFKDIKVDIEKVIRGYFRNGDIYVYQGKDFRVPNITVNQYFQVIGLFNAYNFYLGVLPGEIGKPWKGIYKISIDKI